MVALQQMWSALKQRHAGFRSTLESRQANASSVHCTALRGLSRGKSKGRWLYEGQTGGLWIPDQGTFVDGDKGSYEKIKRASLEGSERCCRVSESRLRCKPSCWIIALANQSWRHSASKYNHGITSRSTTNSCKAWKHRINIIIYSVHIIATNAFIKIWSWRRRGKEGGEWSGHTRKQMNK